MITAVLAALAFFGIGGDHIGVIPVIVNNIAICQTHNTADCAAWRTT